MEKKKFILDPNLKIDKIKNKIYNKKIFILDPNFKTDEIKNKIYNISLEKYKPLHEVIKKYLNDPNYVYKSCDNDHNWLIILKRLPDTITNEKRTNVIDATKAKYRGNKFEVVMIVDIDCPTTTINELNHTYVERSGSLYGFGDYCFSSTVIYKVGEHVKPENQFNEKMDEVCTSGIHFFTNIFQAITYNLKCPNDFTGVWNEYNDDGKLTRSFTYINGSLN